jgi:hypothetical protein
LSVWLLLQDSLPLYADALSVSRPVARYSMSSSSLFAVAGADIEQETDEKEAPQVVGDKIMYRGKVNEIDYCIAPSDVSISSMSGKSISKGDANGGSGENQSLTRALNNASNRAVRRILLAKSWPSEEDFNLSLRLAAAAEKQAVEARKAEATTASGGSKCPVPRPILNLLRTGSRAASATTPVAKKPRTNEEYVADQIVAFRERYGSLSDYSYAEAYLESILSLATTGAESPRVNEVRESGQISRMFWMFSFHDAQILDLVIHSCDRFWNPRCTAGGTRE